MQLTSVLDQFAVAEAPDREREIPTGPPLDHRIGMRDPARLLVAVDGSAASGRQLMWALQEAARREATVLVVAVVRADDDGTARTATRILLDAQLLHAIDQTGVHGRATTALLDEAVYEALTGTAAGADLVMVGPHRKTVLRPAMRRPPAARPLTRCA